MEINIEKIKEIRERFQFMKDLPNDFRQVIIDNFWDIVEYDYKKNLPDIKE
jgi:hypothetical protein